MSVFQQWEKMPLKKIVRKRENTGNQKMLVTSIFSFYHNVFNLEFKDKSYHLNHA